MKEITPEGSIAPVYLDPTPVEQQEADRIAYEEKKAAELAAVQAKESAQAKLAALGLTTDDLKALGL